MMEDKDKDVERRDYVRAKNIRKSRASYKTIYQCIGAEEGSVANMAFKHHTTNGTQFGTQLIDIGICDDELLGDEGYHLLDDINAAVLNAFIAGYTTAITGEVK
jgi:hypothetical protein